MENMIRKILETQKKLTKQGIVCMNIRKIFAAIFGVILLISINACEESNPLDSSLLSTNFDNTSQLNALPDTSINIMFPMFNSKTFYYIDSLGYYEGGNIKFTGNKSKFNMDDSALTPPAATRKGYGVTITMNVDYDQTNNELIFEFGPHGCQFSPAAQVKLDYNPLGIDVATLYYIDENGNYIEQLPDEINLNKKYMMITLNHFSRYAVAYGR